jgi:hypothetical protein
LNEDIKAAFERVAKEYDARADAAKQQRDQELTERQQFEADGRGQGRRDQAALRFLFDGFSGLEEDQCRQAQSC